MRSLLPSKKRQQLFIRKIRRRHQHRGSICGALLSEVAIGRSKTDRATAARVFGDCKCKRGLRILEHVVQEAISDRQQGDDDYDKFRIIRNSYYAIGIISTQESHAVLLRALTSDPDLSIRGWALDGMAFEGETFDRKLVFRYLEPETPEILLLSALWVLMMQGYDLRKPVDARKRVTPLLNHPSPMVRNYLIDFLVNKENNFDIISAYCRDEDSSVRKNARAAVRNMKQNFKELMK